MREPWQSRIFRTLCIYLHLEHEHHPLDPKNTRSLPLTRSSSSLTYANLNTTLQICTWDTLKTHFAPISHHPFDENTINEDRTKFHLFLQHKRARCKPQEEKKLTFRAALLIDSDQTFEGQPGRDLVDLQHYALAKWEMKEEKVSKECRAQMEGNAERNWRGFPWGETKRSYRTLSWFVFPFLSSSNLLETLELLVGAAM